MLNSDVVMFITVFENNSKIQMGQTLNHIFSKNKKYLNVNKAKKKKCVFTVTKPTFFPTFPNIFYDKHFSLWKFLFFVVMQSKFSEKIF